ncbi:hypothetical protein QFZ97_006702 [Paraburkholderia youngii]
MEAIERMMTYLNKELADGKSPYTRLTDDAAIAHLERILSKFRYRCNASENTANAVPILVMQRWKRSK